MSVSLEDGTTGVFNFTPIRVVFSVPPTDVKLKLEPSVVGEVTVQGNELVFVPQEKFSPNTTYTLEIHWKDGERQLNFTSINEIAELYYTDFTGFELDQFPAGWLPFNPLDAADFKVVELAEASGGRALMGFDGGRANAHAVMPTVTLLHADSDILVETTVWLSTGEFTGVYLYHGQPTWPPYASIADVGKYFADENLRSYKLGVVFRLADQKVDVYVDYKPLMTGVDFRTSTPAGNLSYAVGLFFNGDGNSTDVYWGDIRISEIGR
ncbi:MAG TPA: Ig-like domain-containing protein [Firmicutes bacterium]|nr:Ig-like domain-containing protein [Bacillota bacterium]